jgi:uracil-DNA glycosylase family 4
MSTFIPGKGKFGAKLFICADCPLESDFDIFIGKVIKFVKLTPEDIYITSVIKVKSENPSKEDLESWRPLLLNEIKLIEPKVILTLGGGATQTLLNSKEKITKLRGQSYTHPTLPCSIVPAFHPSYLEKQPNNEEIRKQLKFDLTIAKNLL